MAQGRIIRHLVRSQDVDVTGVPGSPSPPEEPESEGGKTGETNDAPDDAYQEQTDVRLFQGHDGESGLMRTSGDSASVGLCAAARTSGRIWGRHIRPPCSCRLDGTQRSPRGGARNGDDRWSGGCGLWIPSGRLGAYDIKRAILHNLLDRHMGARLFCAYCVVHVRPVWDGSIEGNREGISGYGGEPWN